MRTELIQSTERLREIEPAWWQLLDDCPADDFFLTPPWVMAWWEVYSEDRQMFVLAMWEGDDLCALFPLYREHHGFLWRLTFIGHPRLADRMDFAIARERQEECLQAFADFAMNRRDWDYLCLREFGAYTDAPERLAEIARARRRYCMLEENTACAYIPTSDFTDVDAYLSHTRSKKRAKDLRRRRRRMAERGDARFEILNHIDRDLLDEMEELDCFLSLRGKENRCFFQVPLNKVFLRTLGRELRGRDHLRLITLRIDGALKAYDLLYVYRDKMLAYQGAFDDALRSESIGTLTFLQTLEYAIDSGFREYDFLSGEEEYKSEWADEARVNRRLMVYSGSLRSRIVCFYHRFIKPMRRRLGRVRSLRELVPERIRRKIDF